MDTTVKPQVVDSREWKVGKPPSTVLNLEEFVLVPYYDKDKVFAVEPSEPDEEHKGTGQDHHQQQQEEEEEEEEQCPHGIQLLHVHEKQRPIILRGHSTPVMDISYNKQTGLIASTSKDAILFWGAEDVLRFGRSTSSNTRLPCPRTCHTNFSSKPSSACLDSRAMYLFVCVTSSVHIYSVSRGNIEMVLQDHQGRVTDIGTVWREDLLFCVTVSDDRSFKVWNVTTKQMIYDSGVISPAPLSCVAIDTATVSSSLFGFAVGSTEGHLRLYAIATAPSLSCRLVHTRDVHRHSISMAQSIVLGTPSLDSSPNTPVVVSKRGVRPLDDEEELKLMESLNLENESGVDISRSLLKMQYLDVSSNKHGHILCCVYPEGIAFLSLVNYAVLHTLLFTSDERSVAALMKTARVAVLSIGLVQAIAPITVFTCHPVTETPPPDSTDSSLGIRLTCAGPFDGLVHHICCTMNFDSDRSATGSLLSLLDAGGADPDTSRLCRYTFLSKTGSSGSSGKGMSGGGSKSKAAKGKKGSHSLTNKPVTFNSKIRSSGYNPAVVQKDKSVYKSTPGRWTGKTRGGSKSKGSGSVSRSASESSVTSVDGAREYPISCDLLIEPQLKSTKAISDPAQSSRMLGKIHDGPIYACQYTRTGSHVLTCSADGSVAVSRLPPSRFKAPVKHYMGHSNSVTCCGWSARPQGNRSRKKSSAANSSGHMFVSGSADMTARVWITGRSDSLLVMDTIKSHHAASDTNPTFSRPITNVSFFHQDRFIALTSGNSIFVYKYLIDENASNDIERMKNSNQYRLVYREDAGDAKTISALACLNANASRYILSAVSDRSLQVLDVEAGQVCARTEQCHSKSIHTIRVNDNPAVGIGESEQLFLTSSTDGTIKLWDFRTMSCVRHFEGHINRHQYVGMNFSPCMRYVATGSEDQRCYMYDIGSDSSKGSGTYISRFGTHLDVVSDVAFHPTYPQLITTSYDGCLRFFHQG